MRTQAGCFSRYSLLEVQFGMSPSWHRPDAVLVTFNDEFTRGSSVSEFPPAPGQHMRRQGHDNSSSDAALDAALLDAVSEAFSSAFIIYDRNDQLIFASRSARQFVPLPPAFFEVGTRLRDVLAAAYDAGIRYAADGQAHAASLSREEWLTRQIATHWKERYEIQACDDGKRWTRLSKRRLSSGFGFCVMSDITEQKRREEQWRADIERVQLTEEILDNLAHPVFVQDRNLQLVAVNKVFCSAISVGADSALGGNIAALFDLEIAARLAAAARDVLETGITSSLTLPMRLYGDPPRPILVHVQRVGKPGRYLVVSSFGEVGGIASDGPGHQDARPIPSLETEARSNPVDGRLTGRKALLVTRDRNFETRALEVLQLLGLDSCCVRDVQELDAFLTVAQSVGVAIDIAVVDINLDMHCIELLQAVDVDYLTLPASDIAGELAFSVLDRLTALHAPRPPIDDWEISTEGTPSLPAAPLLFTERKAPPIPRQPATPPSPELVLVAEDNEINQIVFSQILEGLGYAYRICADGETAVRLWAELQPRIVLMDVTLPGINGFEAARRIRQMPQQANADATPIIGVLAQAFDRDREACFASGMNDVILKPLSPDIVDQAIRRLVPDIARLASTA